MTARRLEYLSSLLRIATLRLIVNSMINNVRDVFREKCLPLYHRLQKYSCGRNISPLYWNLNSLQHSIVTRLAQQIAVGGL